MSTFAPVYRVPASQQSFLVRDHRRRQKLKRKRISEDADGLGDAASANSSGVSDFESDSSLTTTRSTTARSHHTDSDDDARSSGALSKKDPHYVAGYSRNKPLPGGNFPHAAAPLTTSEYDVRSQTKTRVIEEELAKLKLFVPKSVLSSKTHSTSLKARHVNNLTAIMHRCMLEGDWQRAKRAWSILLRIEVGGHGMDIRAHGRWTIGAELLMRTGGNSKQEPTTAGLSESMNDTQGEADRCGQQRQVQEFTEEGFKLARDYYERLILQFPHTQHTQHSLVTARVIYPALFNIWVYQVQDSSERARRAIQREMIASSPPHSERPHPSKRDETPPWRSLASTAARNKKALRAVTTRELDQASQIDQRLSDVVSGPPFDTNVYLRRLQGNICVWMANLHRHLGGYETNWDDISSEDSDDDEDDVDMSMEDVKIESPVYHRSRTRLSRAAHRERGLREWERGSELLERFPEEE
jgi:hypothetical protein